MYYNAQLQPIEVSKNYAAHYTLIKISFMFIYVITG